MVLARQHANAVNTKQRGWRQGVNGSAAVRLQKQKAPPQFAKFELDDIPQNENLHRLKSRAGAACVRGEEAVPQPLQLLLPLERSSDLSICAHRKGLSQRCIHTGSSRRRQRTRVAVTPPASWLVTWLRLAHRCAAQTRGRAFPAPLRSIGWKAPSFRPGRKRCELGLCFHSTSLQPTVEDASESQSPSETASR